MLSVSVTDSSGVTGSTTTLTDTIDSVAPTVTLTSKAEASNVATQTIAGTVVSGGTAAVAGQTVTFTDNGTTAWHHHGGGQRHVLGLRDPG